MALPSQSARSRNSSYGPRFTVSRRRPRRGRARLILAIFLLVVGLVSIYLFQLGGDDPQTTPVAANTDETDSNDGAAQNTPVQRPLTAGPTGGNRPATPAPQPDPTRELVMGGSGGTTPSNQPDTTPTPERQRDPLQTPADRTERPATNQPQQPTPQRPSGTDTGGRAAEIQSLIRSGDDHMARGHAPAAREAYNRALHHARATEADRAVLREKLTGIAQELTFSGRVVPGDEMAYEYTVRQGDLLSTIVRREGLDVEWMLIERVNGVSANRIRVGQTLKLLRGPFHAVISKSAYRLDLYSDFRDSAGNRLYLGSYSVGLGEYDSTPEGAWVVRTNSKLIDPAWVNPRTGERFASKDPENPIGNRWIGIRGTDSNTENEEGIGLHGTIEPNSIGQQMSMGCVRMLRADIELMYDLLVPEVSTVQIVR